MRSQTHTLIAETNPDLLRLLSTIVQQDPQLRIHSTPQSPQALLQQLKTTPPPDIILLSLDYAPAHATGLIQQIMRQTPTPIVALASDDVDLASQTPLLLQRGVLNVLPKLPPTESPQSPNARYLLRLLKAMAAVKVVRIKYGPSPSPSPPLSPLPQTPPQSAKVFALAASTGGPSALQHILNRLSPSFHAPILLVQHITAGFVQNFVKWLDESVPLHVKVAQHDEALEPRTVYVANEHHLGLSSSQRIHLSQEPPIQGFRPSASFLFRSVAQHCGPQAVAAILTGMGSDGLLGLQDLHSAGGYILAQDQATSAIFGMPAAAIQAGLVHEILPLHKIGQRLSSWYQPPDEQH